MFSLSLVIVKAENKLVTSGENLHAQHRMILYCAMKSSQVAKWRKSEFPLWAEVVLTHTNPFIMPNSVYLSHLSH